MPIDMALPLYRSKEDFLYRTPHKTCSPALNPCLRFQQTHHVDQTGPEDAASSGTDLRQAQKRVTFADWRGMPLTRTKVFCPFSDPIDVPIMVLQTLSSTVSPAAEQDRLVLDFVQPSSDYLRFRQSLERNYVSLEHCVLKDTVLAGTIKVKNVSFQKSVVLRVTFDGWKTHMDLDCEYMKDTYPSSHCDTFTFSVALPERLRPRERVEFAVCYKVDGREYWDSNQGDNYRVVRSSMKTCRRDSLDFGIHFDRYGSPTCSHGIFPDWPSYAGSENSGPYY